MAATRGSVATRIAVATGAVACLAAVRVALGTASAGLALDVALAAVAIVATLAAARRARPGRTRLGWHAETAAVAVWCLAPLAWLTPLPDGVAVAGRLGFAVCAGTAWWLTSLERDTWSRVRLLIDSLLGGAAAFTVLWSPVLAHVLTHRGNDTEGALAVAVPLAAVAAAMMACGVALTEIVPSRRAMPALVIAGTLTIAASDVAWGLGERPFWAVGWALFALSTTTYRGTTQRREVLSTHRSLVYAPYVLLAPAGAVLLGQYLFATIPPEETAVAVVMVLLLLARQQVTLMENRALVERLACTERRLRHQATHDALTGLAGRVLLHERLDAAIAQRKATGDALAVVFLDLDDFKVVNDTMGHAAGDDVLVQTANRLAGVLAGQGDATAFRMSGDEFAVLLVGAAAQDAAAIAGRMLDALRAPLTVNGRDVRVGGSLGVAVAADDDVDASDLLRAADLAMYAVKHHGKGGVRVADPVAGPERGSDPVAGPDRSPH